MMTHDESKIPDTSEYTKYEGMIESRYLKSKRIPS